MRSTIQISLIFLLLFSGCKSDEESISGKWQITTYNVQGVDSLDQIGRLHLEGILSLTTADQKNSFFDHFQLRTQLGDTTYVFHGSWLIGDRSITLTPTVYIKSVYQNFYYSFNSATTNQNQPYPVFFPLAGKWNIKKQGRNSLDFKKEANKDVELHLRKQ